MFFMAYVLHAGEAGKETYSWHTYVEELLKNEASEVYVRRMKTKEVLVPKEVAKSHFHLSKVL